MKLIDKSALVTEIKRRKELVSDPILLGNDLMIGERNAYFNLLSFIDTLEVKEVDLEKEISDNWESGYELGLGFSQYADIAKHFFELGVNASNLLTWEDIKTIQNISGEVYAEVAKGKVEYYSIYPTEQSFLEEVLRRYKAQKGE